MDLEAVAETVEGSARKISAVCEGSSILEPCVGMEFESEDSAKHFYDEYARREGFIVRLDRCHRSEVDNRITSRRFSCNKQGFYVRGRNGARLVHKPRASIREGCEAMLLIKVNKCGKWVVTKFVKEHSHPLHASSSPSYTMMDSKDRKIQQLTKELQHRDLQCQQYRRLLLSLLETVDEQTELLSRKVELVVNRVKQLENEEQKPLDTH
ncbi:protein FAR1-RELATED SEQUENCE 5-like [Gastrolobium bilobum]|uniref:protein FAR1-RELATED SEQUENCE 5-like n=1 Tax=Gastrolobium bilobum TaxID=150636 RepID=UPI002AB1C22E|nr:protein FAR1-RELATED SEQUENCE 5-like [Gastrolobium bilobum]